ncbi:MAG TPA: hypothetical protein PL015_12405 [Opitutaceae bacterium]|nr:hypothetical protein [Opitutaceae bacterium]
MRHQLPWLSPVQILGNPRRLKRFVPQKVLPRRRPQVKRLQRLVKGQTRRADRLQFRDLAVRQWPGFGSELPGFRLKKRLGPKGTLDLIVGKHARASTQTQKFSGRKTRHTTGHQIGAKHAAAFLKNMGRSFSLPSPSCASSLRTILLP